MFDTSIGYCAPYYIILVIGLSFIVAVIEIVKKYATGLVDIRKARINKSSVSQFIYTFLAFAGTLIILSLFNILFNLNGLLKDTIHLLIKFFLLISSILFFIVPLEYHKAYKEELAIRDADYKS
jgi:cytochrome c oxidase assembly factor CtaG